MEQSVILVAGGAGFLGSYICDYYIEKGCRVVCVDNLSTGSKDNIRHLENNPSFVFVQHDIVKPLPSIVTDNQYNIVFNMASPASPPHYQRLAVETLRVGSEGTLHLLELARKCQARFFQASTSEVYGDPEIHPQPETYKGSVNCYGPRAMYDEAKRYAEALIYVYREKYNVNTCIARFFNTYGPRMDPDDGRVVSNLIVQAINNQPLTIYGDGTQTRSFCYVKDLVEGIILFAESNESGPMNLGNPNEFTIKQLAEKVLEKTKSTSKITFLPLPGDDPTQRKPVIELAEQTIGWSPKIQLNEGLAMTINYFIDRNKKRAI